MDKGWIKLSRKIQDHWIWTDHEYAYAWMDLLLMANHEDKKILVDKQPVIIRRGQMLTSIKKLSTRWKWGRDRVYRFLRALESDNMLTRVSTSSGTTLTIVNYGKFQSKSNTNETSDKTPNETTDKTSDKTSGKTQTRKNKNEKEIKESAPATSDEVLGAEDEEEPPVPGAVKMANGGWNYTPDIDWDAVENGTL